MASRAAQIEKVIERVLTGERSIPADKVASWPPEPRWQKQLRQLLGYEDEPLEKTFAQRATGSTLAGLAVLFGLALCQFVNAFASPSWCLSK